MYNQVRLPWTAVKFRTFSGGRQKCGTPPCLKQVFYCRCWTDWEVLLGAKALSLLTPALLLNFVASSPRSCISLETANITICENLWEKRSGRYLSGLSCSLPWWSPTEILYISFISLLSAFSLAIIYIPKFLAIEGQIKCLTTSSKGQNFPRLDSNPSHLFE